MEEKRNEVQKLFSRKVIKFSCLLFIPELVGIALLLLGVRQPDSTRMLFLIAAMVVLAATMIVNLVGLRKMAAQRDAEIRELEQKYQPLEDWISQNGETDADP